MGRQESPQLIERKTQVDTDAQETSRASKYFLMLQSYLVKNNSVLTAFQLDKKTLKAQLITTEVKRIFYQLKSVDLETSDLWKSFGLVANGKIERLECAVYLACLRAL